MTPGIGSVSVASATLAKAKVESSNARKALEHARKCGSVALPHLRARCARAEAALTAARGVAEAARAVSYAREAAFNAACRQRAAQAARRAA